MRVLTLIILAFTAGWFTNTLYGKYGQQAVSRVIPPPAASGKTLQQSAFVTEIIYENGTFKPDNVTIKLGNYLSVTNRSDSLMWLNSNNPLLSTSRGYARSEQLRIRMDSEGQYSLENKLNLKAKARITVEK
ncbi:hypothetical protein A2Z33_00205 [Candidatus Gottesmanbacteria bacterium RBG_16_52_11]|uniref:Uncharacterized protein n=1 Tax=Candidatus Gottesmanbacteria bacterium RBG_16_52_11 TaxID=1798374 RepID=A0A1F5YNG5_9BACT|nr:MAG: hypothetical protein A2Z33_00205 [Candidatus Gottesmanbacteria bacterium RBG_16_52_11]